MSKHIDTDLLIVGGGLIGATLMHMLAPTGIRCLLVDNKPLPTSADTGFDTRSVALSAASVRILKSIDVWSSFISHAFPIHKIHVSEQGRFGTACFDSQSEEPLGYVIDIQILMYVLYQNLASNTLLIPSTLIGFDDVQCIATVQLGVEQVTIKAKLVVAADGSHSLMRSLCQLSAQIKDYGQHALVTNIGLSRPHQNIAYERFTSSGPLALLPLGPKRMALVWSLFPEEAKWLLAVEEAVFLKTLMEAFGYRLGRLIHVGKRHSYPLQYMFMPQQTKGSVVFIGNAAHTLHPVAAQGFNLGLRDAAILAQIIVQKGLDNTTLLEEYQALRQYDHHAITNFTDFLIKIYTNQRRDVSLLRQLGLLIFDNHALLKQILSRHASGFAGHVADVICGIPLREKI
ncbi:MAG TPA: FAD-dependent monooxygenase [Legionellaceae bacterium]|nr:FAD-dependent monooxygenase [Legionellaceae bacterium]